MKERILIVLVLCMASSGCALTQRDHISTTNWMDRTIVPDNRVAQVALTPVLVPLCVATLAVDNLVICPVVHLPSAWDDCGDFFTAETGDYYADMGFLPVKTALTPIVFAGSWFGRSVFAVEPRHDAAWGWPEWGEQWERDEHGRLTGPRAAPEQEE